LTLYIPLCLQGKQDDVPDEKTRSEKLTENINKLRNDSLTAMEKEVKDAKGLFSTKLIFSESKPGYHVYDTSFVFFKEHKHYYDGKLIKIDYEESVYPAYLTKKYGEPKKGSRYDWMTPKRKYMFPKDLAEGEFIYWEAEVDVTVKDMGKQKMKVVLEYCRFYQNAEKTEGLGVMSVCDIEQATKACKAIFGDKAKDQEPK
jgi:hypothetical protein